MSDQTVSERVQQAVTRGYELLAELNQAKAALRDAKQEEDAVRLASPVEAAKRAAAASRDDLVAAANRVRENTINKAAEALEAARAKHGRAVEEAEETYQRDEAATLAAYQYAVREAEDVQEVRMTEVQAAVHRAGREVAAIETTISQNIRVVKDSLGINLANLIHD